MIKPSDKCRTHIKRGQYWITYFYFIAHDGIKAKTILRFEEELPRGTNLPEGEIIKYN